MAGNIHSTGRGGAGNIGAGEGVYVDGDIVREGVSSPGQTHVGRGGSGNVPLGQPVARGGTPVTPGASLGAPPNISEDHVPETATRGTEGHENFHTGRGGEGNVYREKYGGHSKPQHEHQHVDGGHESIVDKAKHLLHLDGKKASSSDSKAAEPK